MKRLIAAGARRYKQFSFIALSQGGLGPVTGVGDVPFPFAPAHICTLMRVQMPGHLTCTQILVCYKTRLNTNQFEPGGEDATLL